MGFGFCPHLLSKRTGKTSEIAVEVHNHKHGTAQQALREHLGPGQALLGVLWTACGPSLPSQALELYSFIRGCSTLISAPVRAERHLGRVMKSRRAH